METILLRRAIFGLLISGAVAGLRASNQSFDEFSPRPVPSLPAPSSGSEPAVTAAGGSGVEVLVPTLKGIVLVSRQQDVVPAGVTGSGGIVLGPGLDAPAEGKLRADLSPYLGRPFTRSSMRELIVAIIVHYRDNGRPIVDVVVPQQDVTSGIVQVLVLESRVGKVSVTGNHWFPSDEIRSNFRMKTGDRILASDVRSDLAWANQNPFHTTDVVYQPGEAPGTTDVVLQTQDRFPLRLYAGYEDSGNTETGLDRYLVGLNWGDAWNAGWGHQLNYQYTTSSDFKGLQANSGSYVVPLPWHDTLTFFGNYVTTSGEIPPYLSLHGRSYQLSGRYTAPLKPIGDLKQSVGVGFDYKFNLNSLIFGQVPLSSIPIEVRQFVLTYDASLRDNYGLTSLGADLYLSPGGWGGDNNDTVFSDVHGLARSNYTYGTLTASRLNRLPSDWSLLMKATLQVSDGNLVPSEQLGIGGYDTVRGYDEREVNSDQGYVVNIELRAPEFRPAKRLGLSKVDDPMQVLAFWDFGCGYDHTLLPGEPATTRLSSVGLGIRYTISTHVSARADYGRQLATTGLDSLNGGRADVGIVISY